VAVVVFAGFLGVSGGKLYSRWLKDRSQGELTESIVTEMGTINVGDVLPDHVFEDLSRNPVSLSSALPAGGLVTFISPTCPSCQDQITDFAASVAQSEQAGRFVFISGENPRLLEELRDNHNLQAPILYDHHRVYWKQLNINSFPLNVFVDDQMVITDMIAGPLSAAEFSQVLQDESER
jgi:peroxiredoxin